MAAKYFIPGGFGSAPRRSRAARPESARRRSGRDAGGVPERRRRRRPEAPEVVVVLRWRRVKRRVSGRPPTVPFRVANAGWFCRVRPADGLFPTPCSPSDFRCPVLRSPFGRRVPYDRGRVGETGDQATLRRRSSAGAPAVRRESARSGGRSFRSASGWGRRFRMPRAGAVLPSSSRLPAHRATIRSRCSARPKNESARPTITRHRACPGGPTRRRAGVRPVGRRRSLPLRERPVGSPGSTGRRAVSGAVLPFGLPAFGLPIAVRSPCSRRRVGEPDDRATPPGRRPFRSAGGECSWRFRPDDGRFSGAVLTFGPLPLGSRVSIRSRCSVRRKKSRANPTTTRRRAGGSAGSAA